MNHITATVFLIVKEIPNSLYIRGAFLTYSTMDRVRLEPCALPTNNPQILMADLRVFKGSKALKGTERPFRKHIKGNGASAYREVHIRYKDGEADKILKIDVALFGK